ncbi:MAG TPA: class I SAM-dependent methyltransferase, partial [Verrucomicrobiae bacterium]|nr:class I SAM-dependent methyltransferase [Verrucomicrobiae bacterium]
MERGSVTRNQVLGMKRVIEPEWLDELPAEHAGAAGSRRDLQRLNRIMDHGGILRGLLESEMNGRRPGRIVELGAGDGTLMLQLAKHLSRRWPRGEVVLVDCKNAVTDETQAGFASLGWAMETVTADIFDWLKKPAEPADAMIANLFLHHFSEEQLARMLRLAAARTRLFAACEPRRAALPLLFSRLVGLIG